MSTSALIAYKNEKGNYDVNAINFDGYIEGVGQILQEYCLFSQLFHPL